MSTHPKRYPYEGREVTLRELEAETGIAVKTLRTRLRMGWTVEEMASTPLDVQRSMASHGVHGRGWKWRTEWLRPKVLGYARTRDQTRYRDVDDLPLAYDPWAQAAIAQAERDGGWPLDLVGHVMGGITRERVRQIELMAMAKVRRAMGGKSKEEIVTMLRALETDRRVNTNSFELVESLDYGECQLKQKRKEAKP